MRTAPLTLCALLLAGTASAAPITTGSWQTLQPCAAPYSCRSYDGSQSHLTTILGDVTQWQHLDGATFRFPDFANAGTLYMATGFPTTLRQDAHGAFVMDNGHGGIWSSDGLGWNHFLLLWRVLTPAHSEYIVTVEDLPFAGEVGYGLPGIPVSDDDFSDLMIHAYVTTTPGEGGKPVPEPASLALFAAGAFAAARRLRRRG